MDTQPDEVKIACPHCGQHLVIDEFMLGTELECPACKQTFCVESTEESSASPEGRLSPNDSPVGTGTTGLETGAKAPESAGCGGYKNRSRSKRRRRVVGVAIAVLVLLVLLGLCRGDSGVLLSVEDIIQGKRGCTLIEKGKGLRTNGRNLLSYKLPLELQADRISFDIRPHDDKEVILSTKIALHTGTGMWAPSIDIPGAGTKLKKERWTHVDVRLREKDAIVTIGGKKKKVPRPSGVRFSMLAIGNETDFSVRNIAIHPSRRHRKAVKTFQDAIALAGEENIAKKMKMFGKAAEMGLAEAQSSYALFGQLGWGGVTLSPREQEQWLRRSAEQGDAQAQWCLGIAMLNGRLFSPKSEREALKWLRAASEGGNVRAMLECADLLLHGDEVDHDSKEAQALLDKCTAAILFGDAEDLDDQQKGRAYFYSALTYATGEDGAEKDRSKALDHLRKAAQFGDEEAIKALRKL